MKQVEFFTADCRLCEESLRILEKTFPETDMTVHRASECKDGSCCTLAAQYGVVAVPSLVVDEQVVLVGLPNEAALRYLESVLKTAHTG